MPVIYKGKKLIPLSTAGFVKNIIKSGESEHVNYIYTITLDGHLLPYKGSPNALGVFWDQAGYPPDDTFAADTELRNLVAKQTAISDLFSVEGGLLEFQPWDGGPDIKCNPRIVSIEWPEGEWTSEIPYRINLEAPHIFYEGNLGSGYLDIPTIRDYNVSQVGETWNISLNEEDEFWSISRELTAKGDRVFNEQGVLTNEPWHEARRWCLASASSGTLPDFARFSDPQTSGLAGFVGYNYARVTSPNIKDGGFSLSETWVATSGNRPYIESFDVAYTRSNEDGLDNVTINGEIRGLDFTTNNIFPASGKLAMANIAFSGIWIFDGGDDITYQRAKLYSEINDLNIVPKSSSTTKRPKQGIISYSCEYDNRPLNFITGSLVERITVDDDHPIKIRPILTIPGRPSPLIQDIGANKPGTRTLNIAVLMDRRKNPYAALVSGVANYALLPRPHVSGLANLFIPPGIDGYDYTMVTDNDKWDCQRLKLDKTITWVAHAI